MQVFDLQPGTRCTLCSAVLAVRIACDPHGRFFCGHHVDSGRQCCFCDRFFLARGSAGEECPDCAGSRVVRYAEAHGEVQAVRRWFAAVGLPIAGAPQLLLRAHMPRSPLVRGVGTLGFVEWLYTGLGSSVRFPARVVVQQGLPRALMRAVLAHEFGHVLLDEARLRLPVSIEEGSCDWLAHRHLAACPGEGAAMQRRRIELRRDPIYGAGFRWVSERLEGQPPAALPALLRAGACRVNARAAGRPVPDATTKGAKR